LSNATGGNAGRGCNGPETEEFLRLLGAHERDLFTYVYALSPSWQDAQEVMQRVRIRLWQQFDQFDNTKSFSPWARAIAYYQILTYRREQSRQREVFNESLLEQISEKFEGFSRGTDERREALLGCLDKLGTRNRDLVYAYYGSHRQATEEIASELSMTPSALRQAIYRIRKSLADCAQNYLGSRRDK